MGYRLRIYPEGFHTEYVGDDHKLYGYNDFEAVEDSVTYLFPFLRRHHDYYTTPEEAYGVAFLGGFGPEIILNETEYAEFMELYLADAEKCWNKKYGDCHESIERIRQYMTKMKEIPGNKVLLWG